jgi:hypothetical protein
VGRSGLSRPDRRDQGAAPNALDFTNQRYLHRGLVDEAARARNRTKSKVRSKVDHAFYVIKRLFGFVMVRYRGLDKNARCHRGRPGGVLRVFFAMSKPNNE